MSSRAHRIFGPTLAAVVAVVTLAAVDAAFRASPEAPIYRRAADRLVRLSEDAGSLLRVLLDRDEVTWDPTNGAELSTVLAHLKDGRGEHVLLLGSSQLLTLRDDRSVGSFTRRVDKLIEHEAALPVTVYNLSIGGMSAPEKALVLERAAGAVRLDEIVLALTLSDSISASRRGIVNRLARVDPRAKEPFGASDDRSGPAAVNRIVGASIEHALRDHVALFRDRSAIQSWLSDGVGAVSSASRPPIRTTEPAAPILAAGALPMQYVYSEEELSRAIANIESLLRTTAALRDRHGFRVSVLLTPFRQDDRLPAYDPTEYGRFRASVREACRRSGFELIDASELLEASHFGVYELGEERGRIDVLHFDASGHEILAGVLSRAIGLDGTRLLAKTR